jgi:SAM-dependent methyltransferase
MGIKTNKIRISAEGPYPPEAYAVLAKAEAGHWWFEARNRIIIWALRNKVHRFESFLEIGCGTGFVLQAVSHTFPDARIYGSEYHLRGLYHAKRRVPTGEFRQLDATKLDEVECYDAIGAFDVIEHIKADKLVINNLCRALRHSGSLILTVPQHPLLWSSADDYAHHIRRYIRSNIIQLLEEAGLEVTYATSFVTLLLPLMIFQRWRFRNKPYNPADEFEIHPWLNKILAKVMELEYLLVRHGLSLPAGGSLLLIAKRP